MKKTHPAKELAYLAFIILAIFTFVFVTMRPVTDNHTEAPQTEIASILFNKAVDLKEKGQDKEANKCLDALAARDDFFDLEILRLVFEAYRNQQSKQRAEWAMTHLLTTVSGVRIYSLQNSDHKCKAFLVFLRWLAEHHHHTMPQWAIDVTVQTLRFELEVNRVSNSNFDDFLGYDQEFVEVFMAFAKEPEDLDWVYTHTIGIYPKNDPTMAKLKAKLLETEDLARLAMLINRLLPDNELNESAKTRFRVLLKTATPHKLLHFVIYGPKNFTPEMQAVISLLKTNGIALDMGTQIIRPAFDGPCPLKGDYYSLPFRSYLIYELKRHQSDFWYFMRTVLALENPPEWIWLYAPSPTTAAEVINVLAHDHQRLSVLEIDALCTQFFSQCDWECLTAIGNNVSLHLPNAFWQQAKNLAGDSIERLAALESWAYIRPDDKNDQIEAIGLKLVEQL